MAPSNHPQVEIAASVDHTDKLESARTKQQVILEVLTAHSGEGHLTMRQALLDGLLLHGLPTPVDPWLDAVTAELVEGRAYVVAPDLDTSQFDHDLSEPPPSSLT